MSLPLFVRNSPRLVLTLSICLSATWCFAEQEQKFSSSQIEFFENKIRPLLASRCYSCHSQKAKKLKAELYLDSRKLMLKGGESGPAIVAGDPDKSLLIQAVRFESVEMPPDGKLKTAEIALLEEWVKQGAPWPAEETKPTAQQPTTIADWSKLRASHWAWQPVQLPKVPAVSNPDWARSNNIDNFIHAKLAAKKLSPNPAASARHLIRRVYLNLVGMPPTPDRVSQFEREFNNDKTRNSAIKNLIEELLSSKSYGERWGRYWLDVARYSDDSNAQAWRYRDWVVRAFNADTPYDQFVKLQIAGDLISENKEDALATGYFSLGPTYKSDGGDPDSVAQAKGETLDDRVDTFSRGLLALTVSCARCHDHKFDPIPQLDYYSIAGIFNNTRTAVVPLAPWDVVEQYNKEQAVIQKLDKQIRDLQNKLKKEKREANNVEKKQLESWRAEVTAARKIASPKYPTGSGLQDSGSSDMHLAIRGNLRKPGPKAPRRSPRILSELEPVAFSQGSGRIELADAVANAANPLTARVFVNRVWMHHFGQGLVHSPSNFGTLGQLPTHPKLLDWLTSQFIESGWSIKNLQRLILASSTYQMSSVKNPNSFQIDGNNGLLWRMNPRRMDAESWRDSLLHITNELDQTSFGVPHDNIVATKRRTLYAKVSRNGDRFASDRFLRLFDFPLMRATVDKRPVSIVPQQFLFMMNSDFMVKRATALVARLNQDAKTDEHRIQRAYELIYSRAPNERELAIGLSFIKGDSKPVEAKPPAPAKQPKPGADILLADFEGDDYGKWTASGAAFGKRPAAGTLPGQMVVSGFQGGGLVNSFLGGDGPQGLLVSPAFRLERKFVRFLIGGGGYPGVTCMNLKVAGKVVRSAVGPNTQGGGSEQLAWKHWDVAEFAGQKAVIEIVDKSSGGWGHINVDHVFQSNEAKQSVPAANARTTQKKPKLSRWVQYAQVLLSSNEFMYIR